MYPDQPFLKNGIGNGNKNNTIKISLLRVSLNTIFNTIFENGIGNGNKYHTNQTSLLRVSLDTIFNTIFEEWYWK